MISVSLIYHCRQSQLSVLASAVVRASSPRSVDPLVDRAV